jgi:hypothetical protein
MNKSFIKMAVAKSVLTIALIGGASVTQAQVLGGGAGGGLGGNLGGTLGGSMGSIGGVGQGSMNGTLGGTIEHADTLRHTRSGALERTRDAGGHVRDRAAGTRGTAQDAASSSGELAGSVVATRDAMPVPQAQGAPGLPSTPSAPDSLPAMPALPSTDKHASVTGNANGNAGLIATTPAADSTRPQHLASPVDAHANADGNATANASADVSGG